jgi:hypothetical protein
VGASPGRTFSSRRELQRCPWHTRILLDGVIADDPAANCTDVDRQDERGRSRTDTSGGEKNPHLAAIFGSAKVYSKVVGGMSALNTTFSSSFALLSAPPTIILP